MEDPVRGDHKSSVSDKNSKVEYKDLLKSINASSVASFLSSKDKLKLINYFYEYQKLELSDAVKILRENGTNDISLLHCTTEYPAPYADVNLRAMNTLRETFGCPVGYSDHTPGIEIPVAAVAMGAKIIEKHFTLDKTMEGPDHAASLEPDELAAMVKAIRNVEYALGDGIKKPGASEIENIAIARKSIVAARDIKSGEIFTEENITTKRPGNGISPMRWFEILGMQAKRDFAEDELIEI